MAEQLKVTLVKSPAGRLKNHKACVRGLGLRRMNDSRVVSATPENRGMISRVHYLLQVEEV